MSGHVCWMTEPPDGYCPACRGEYQAEGAAIAFGLMGMAYAIREADADRRTRASAPGIMKWFDHWHGNGDKGDE
jgi:hypothetical protein